MKKKEILIPADVPPSKHATFTKNYEAITSMTGNLMLFAGDQKIEHLNQDFYGKEIHTDAQNPKHLFEIAQEGRIGAFATQLGLISRYGKEFPKINYIAKMNSKTYLSKPQEELPPSTQIWNIENIMEIKKSANLNICGIGYTVYIGSKEEWKMLHEAAQLTREAHKNGMVSILWMYPRGKHVQNPRDANIIAGAAGVGTCLGADFVKINPPAGQFRKKSYELLKQAVEAAGNTKVICSGGEKENPEQFLQTLYNQINIGGTHGSAAGRNIFQNSKKDAIAMTKAISAIVFDGKNVKTAIKKL